MSSPGFSHKSSQSSATDKKTHRAGSNSSRKNSLSDGMCGNEGRSRENCGKCCKLVREREDCIECELCVSWYHLRCTNLLAADLATCEKKGVHWYCEKCNETIGTLHKRFQAIDKNMCSVKKEISEALEKQKVEASRQATELLERFQQQNVDFEHSVKRVVSECMNEANKTQEVSLRKTYADMAAELKEKTDLIENSFKTQTQSILQGQVKLENEKSEKENRAKNVIIFGLKEPSSECTAQALRAFMSSTCHLSVQFDDRDVTRLGSKKMEGKGRPIRLVLQNENIKWEVLKRINSVHADGIFARNDMNKKERELDFLLRKELKEVREKDPRGKYKIFRKKVVKIGAEA